MAVVVRVVVWQPHTAVRTYILYIHSSHAHFACWNSIYVCQSVSHAVESQADDDATHINIQHWLETHHHLLQQTLTLRHTHTRLSRNENMPAAAAASQSVSAHGIVHVVWMGR